MNPYERSVLSDAFCEESFKKGEYIIRQGEEGNKFYFIEEGEAIATINQNGEEEKKVYSYQRGDYFGEIALIKNEPRQANIVCLTDC
jgi:cAMP-dependent protein kinase regulator